MPLNEKTKCAGQHNIKHSIQSKKSRFSLANPKISEALLNIGNPGQLGAKPFKGIFFEGGNTKPP